MADSLFAKDEGTLAFLRNPRADRRLIARAIRGEGVFSDLPLRTRFEYAIEAATAPYIDSPTYPGKDSPDSNEMDFRRPNQALLSVLKEVMVEADAKHREHFAGEAFRRLAGRWAGSTTEYERGDAFAVASDDWLTPEDKTACESFDWNTRYTEATKRSATRLIEWATSLAQNEPISPKPEQKPYQFDGAVGCLASYLIYHAIRLHDQVVSYSQGKQITSKAPSSSAPARLSDALRGSPAWVVRAGALAATFHDQMSKELNAGKRIALAKQIIESEFKDSATAVRGLSACRFFWGVRNSSDEISSAFFNLSRHSPEAERAYAFECEFAGEYQFADERDEIIERHNAKSLELETHEEAQTEAGQLRVLSRQVGLLAGQLKSLHSMVLWGGLIVAGLVLFRH